MVLNGTSQKSSTYKSKAIYSAWCYVNKALTTRGVARGYEWFDRPGRQSGQQSENFK